MSTPTVLRERIDGLSVLARRDLASLWQRLEVAAQAEGPLRDILPGLVAVYGQAASAVAADWYDEVRDKAGVSGRFTARVPDEGDLGTQALVGWALTEVADPTDVGSLRALIEGGMQRRIANSARGVVMDSSVADPAADGWQRVGNGACAFCRLLIGRGAVYRTASSASFASHDHCNCAAAPAFGGLPLPVRPFTPSARQSTPAERAAVRQYIRDHDL